jgi:hypothetical protein
LIKDHVLLKRASMLADVASRMATLLTVDRLENLVESIPNLWLDNDPGFADQGSVRAAYLDFFVSRLQASDVFVEEAIRARSSHL